jgi:hypothetical protein
MSKKNKKKRNILSLSGGKDSAALAVYLKDKIPDLEYVFLDTGHELPETYQYLDRMRAILGIKIVALKPSRDFDYWLKIFNGCLPSPQNRWCTRNLKIKPYEKYIGQDLANSYMGLRADEDRMGYISHSGNIVPQYPFIEDGLIKSDIIQLLEVCGLGLPKYYDWRSRSGCYFCFFQRREEWIGLKHNHPDLFDKARQYEENHNDGRTYTWIQGLSLTDLIENEEEIMENSRKRQSDFEQTNGKLSETLKGFSFEGNGDSILNPSPEEDDKPCLICTL